MSTTTSSTFSQDIIAARNQTSSTGQNSRPGNRENDQPLQVRYSSLINALSSFRESTTDGGVRLRKNFPRLRWTFRLHNDCIITILPQTASSEELLTKTSNIWLARNQISESLPHLDAIRWIKETAGLSQERIGQLVNVTRQTIINWEKGESITDAHQQKLLAVRDVLERATRLYPTQAQLKAWLDTPRGVDGRTPAQLLEANEINRARLLAVSSPSPHLVRAPAWVKRKIPEKFLAGAERRQEALSSETDNELSRLIDEGEYGINEDGEAFPLP
jgi:DNA-binding XRE family transcriptional regulator